MKAVYRLSLALCGCALVAACQEPPPPEGPGEAVGFDCEIPGRIASPVGISLVSDTTAQAPSRSMVVVDKPVVVACVGDLLEWQSDPATILAWEIAWEGESPLADEVAPSGDEEGRGGGQAAAVGIFKYTVRVTTPDSVQIELDPDAVILPGR